MVDTKSLEATRANWEGSHGRVAAAYSQGIKGAKDVIAKAIAGEDNYVAGVSAAAAEGRRAKGLQKVSDEQWRAAALEKGATRIAAGMAGSKQKYASGMGGVLSTIQGVSLPPRTQDAATNVANRVTPIAVALQNAKRR